MHIITGTGVGGAEMMLFKLVSSMDRNRFQNIVYSLIEPGPTADLIRAHGIEVQTLGMKQGRPDLRAIPRLAGAIRKFRPNIIQTWMYHADLLGGLIGRLVCGVPVIWNVRHSNFDREGSRWLTCRVADLCGQISAFVPERIVLCAGSSQVIHARLGYRTSKMTVIPNGFDLDIYRPRTGSEQICEERFGIRESSKLVSLVARYHPQKDHATFFQAAKICAESIPDVMFALCGDDITEANRELMHLVTQAGVESRTRLLGRLTPDDTALIMSRSSVVTSSSSWGEAFPNVLGEAMACGTVCVATDVGDSSYIVGDTGIIVPVRSPEKLAEAWIDVLESDHKTMSDWRDRVRRRVETNFSLPAIASRYEDLYTEFAR